MKSITLVVTALSVALGAGQALARSAADLKTMSTSAGAAALIANAKRERKSDQPTFTQPILKFSPYTASLEYRAAVGPAAIHETEAEMFYVIEGSGTLVLGDKLVNEKRSNDQSDGHGIAGGSSRKVGKGDFFVVPEKTAHWFSTIDGTLVLMSLHLPRPVPSEQQRGSRHRLAAWTQVRRRQGCGTPRHQETLPARNCWC